MADVHHSPLVDSSEMKMVAGPWRISTGGLTMLMRVLVVAVTIICILLLVTLGLVVSVTLRVGKVEIALAMAKGYNETFRTPTVVFALKSASDSNIVNGKMLKFTTTMTNIGGGVDCDTPGMFKAPYSGTYLFHTSVCAQKEKWVYVNLVANNQTLVTTGVYDAEAHGSCASGTSIAVLSKGDKAWVEGAWDGDNSLYINNKYSLPTFTGVLLQKL